MEDPTLPILEARHLTKEFKRYKSRPGLAGAFRDLFSRQVTTFRAVDDVNLTLEPGEMVGYIGPNGAGKSTTIKMMTGILVPTSGDLRVNGFVPWRERERFVRTIGVVFGQRSQLWWDIAVRESYSLLQKIYRVPDEQYRRHFGELVDVLGLSELMDIPVRKLSLGQRMRCELAAALLHNPPLVFLDEPTIGLDVVVKLRIREFLHDVNRRYGTTILLTTHDLSDIEALCQRVVILDQGRILYDGGLDDLRRDWAGERVVRMQFAQPVPALAEPLTAAALDSDGQPLLGRLPVRWTKEDDLTWEAVLTDQHLTVSDFLALVASYHPVRDISVVETRLEEVIRRIYEGGEPHGA